MATSDKVHSGSKSIVVEKAVTARTPVTSTDPLEGDGLVGGSDIESTILIGRLSLESKNGKSYDFHCIVFFNRWKDRHISGKYYAVKVCSILIALTITTRKDIRKGLDSSFCIPGTYEHFELDSIDSFKDISKKST